MATKACEILVLLFVGLALGFWVIDMTTHGWLIIHQVEYHYDDYPELPSEVSMNE